MCASQETGCCFPSENSTRPGGVTRTTLPSSHPARIWSLRQVQQKNAELSVLTQLGRVNIDVGFWGEGFGGNRA